MKDDGGLTSDDRDDVVEYEGESQVEYKRVGEALLK